MKKLFCMILLLSMLAELCACARTQPQETTLPSTEINPTEIGPEALTEQGDAYAKKDDLLSLAMAEICYVQALAQDPDNEALYTKRAELYLSMGDEGKAVEILADGAGQVSSEKFRKEANQKLEAWNTKQWKHLMAEAEDADIGGDLEAAIGFCSAALELDPDNVDTLLARAGLYKRKPGCLEEAAADYASALKVDPEQEALYIMLADAYSEQEQFEQAAEVINQGIEVLDSEVLKEELIKLEAAKYSDEDLLQLVNDTIMDLYYFQYELDWGVLFELDHSEEIEIEGEKWNPWCKVKDPNVKSMADVENIWYERFTADYPMPALTRYKDVNGELYALLIKGIGGMMWLDSFDMISVYRRAGTSAILYGFQNCYHGMQWQEYQVPFAYYMSYEDSTWKCSGYALYEDGAWEFSGWESRETTAADMPDPYEIDPPPITLPDEPEDEGPELREEDVQWPSEHPKDCIPDEQEVSCEELVQESWRWSTGTSIGSAYNLWFMNDGTFYALGFNGITQVAGWYEYNGHELYLNGLQYVADEEGYLSPIPYYNIFGYNQGSDEPFYRTIKRGERVYDLPQFMKDRYEEKPEETEPEETEPETTEPQETLPPDTTGPKLPEPLALEIQAAPESELWSGRPEPMLEAAASAAAAQIGCSAMQEQMALFEALLCNQEFVRACLTQELTETLCGEAFRDYYKQFLKQYGTESSWKKKAYQAAAGICLNVVKRNPHVLKAILSEAICNNPGEMLPVISAICKQPETGRKLPASLRLHVVLLEKFQKEYADYEKLGEPEGTGAADQVAGFRGSYEYLKVHFSWYIQKITQIACQDVNHGGLAQKERVYEFCKMAEQDKAELIQDVTACQTWSFKMLHKEEFNQLETLKEEISSLSTDFDKLYWILAAHGIGGRKAGLLEEAPVHISKQDTAELSVKAPLSDPAWLQNAELISCDQKSLQILSSKVSGDQLTAVVKSSGSGTGYVMLLHDGRIVDTATIRTRGTSGS